MKVEEFINKIQSDKDCASQFSKNPVKAVESIIGVQLPEKQINPIIDVVKAKISSDKVEGLIGKAKNLF
ncbi:MULTISPECIES: hypothetical protein [unclassified Sporosarcina]|uniref:hypothetical protein n=1 Tax=unclassified Sporosarcina TaxID=2647733 RepID=UPI000C164C6E|nr:MULTISPECIES: hypothetical protein [unclassified Sporosarcina]PID02694.1 hypothetical protein CSV66_16400 [Sporosarcina sp. P30]PID07398.1 hypothetical protein CSV65_16415 [Sporosarcina sp. P31]PID10593.1 hypothetical protein CSV64_16410 [Sporosarcina sp. P32b]